jgi:predicted exporter
MRHERLVVSDVWLRRGTLALVAALGCYILLRLEVTNSIVHFIPSRDDAALVELALELVDSPLARRMVLSIGGGPERHRIAHELAAALGSHPEVEWVTSEFGEEALGAVHQLYFERRVFMASERPAVELPALLEPAQLAKRAAALKRELAQPRSMLVARTAPYDPLGLFDRIIARLQRAQPASSSGAGGLTSVDGTHAIVLLGLRSSPFDSAQQGPLLSLIESEFARLRDAAGGGYSLEQSGVNRVAIASETSIRGDANLISIVATSVVCLLFGIVFRSLRYLAVAFLVPIGGLAVALAVACSSADPVHGITIAFGFVLLGVTVDYPIHLMNHHAFSPAGTTPRVTLARIRPSLLLSGLTTTIAFLALSLSDFPGLGQMGAFGAVGVPFALAMTLLCIPSFLNPSSAPSSGQRAIAAGCEGLVRWLERHRGLVVSFLGLLACIAVVGLPQLRWQDDPGSLLAADPELLAESERVRRQVADFETGRLVVGLAPTQEGALALNDEIQARLEALIAAGSLGGMRSLHSFIWSQALQRENLAALRSVPDLGDRIERAFSQQGFRAGAFRGFDAAVASPAAAPLRPEDFAGTALERSLDSLVELEGRFAAVTYLRGVVSGEAMRDALAGLASVHYIDQGEVVGEIYQGYRRSTVRMMGIGAAVVLLLLLLARPGRRGLLAFLAPSLAALTTFGLFGIFAVPVNIVAAISLLVVLGMGVDYGIFAVDAARDPARLGATLSSLFVSCMTSVFVFGALALSPQPALRGIGLTTGVGVLVALALAPAILVLASKERAAE